MPDETGSLTYIVQFSQAVGFDLMPSRTLKFEEENHSHFGKFGSDILQKLNGHSLLRREDSLLPVQTEILPFSNGEADQLALFIFPSVKFEKLANGLRQFSFVYYRHAINRLRLSRFKISQFWEAIIQLEEENHEYRYNVGIESERK